MVAAPWVAVAVFVLCFHNNDSRAIRCQSPGGAIYPGCLDQNEAELPQPSNHQVQLLHDELSPVLEDAQSGITSPGKGSGSNTDMKEADSQLQDTTDGMDNMNAYSEVYWDSKKVNPTTDDSNTEFTICDKLNQAECRDLIETLNDMEHEIALDEEDLVSDDDSSEDRVKRATALQNKLLASKLKRVKPAQAKQMRKAWDFYRKWRSEKGYGKPVGRWGRSVDNQTKRRFKNYTKSDTKRKFLLLLLKKAMEKNSNQTVNKARIQGAKPLRKLPTNRIQGKSLRKLPISIKAKLLRYKLWRQKNGHGVARGRWG